MSDTNRKSSTFKARVQPLVSLMSVRILEEKFFRAIYQRNIPQITLYLSRGANPNTRSEEYGVSPLHILAERNDYILGYHLMECAGISLNVRSIHGYTPLHIACLFSCKKFVRCLLQKGANVNLPDRFNKTPLHIAVERENFGIVLQLLKFGAKVNVLDCFENTPLYDSIIVHCNLLIAKALLKNGANLSFEHHRTLHIFFETILQCCSIDQIDFVNLLLQSGVSINLRDTATGRNCLHFVALTGYLELAVFLVERGARTNTIDIRRRTPAKAALDHGNLVVFEFFQTVFQQQKLGDSEGLK